MGFSNPHYLYLLALLSALAGSLYLGYRFRRSVADKFRPPRFRYETAGNTGHLHDIVSGIGLVLAATMMILGAAGPYLLDSPVKVPEGPVEACFVVDVSRSMAAEDYRDHMPDDAGKKPDLNKPWGARLDMARYQINAMIDAIKGNRLCLVTYTEEGFPLALLSDDASALKFVLKHWVKHGSAPGEGSNYARGILSALDLLADGAKEKQKVIILLTDGGYTGSQEDLDDAVDRLKDEKVKLVIVGLGMPGQNAIPVYKDGAREGVMEVDGKPITTSYEENAIRNLKSLTDAGYQHIGLDGGSQVVTVDWMSQISGSKTVYQKRMLDKYFAMAAFALIALVVIQGLLTQGRK